MQELTINQKNIKLTDELFELLKEHRAGLALNESLTLLMQEKLLGYGDEEILYALALNDNIDEKILEQLLKMYSWGGEDFFENDDNRDVSAAIILRFYKNIERNHNVQYATTGFMHLVSQTTDTQLLRAISLLEPIKHNSKIQFEIAS